MALCNALSCRRNQITQVTFDQVTFNKILCVGTALPLGRQQTKRKGFTFDVYWQISVGLGFIFYYLLFIFKMFVVIKCT